MPTRRKASISSIPPDNLCGLTFFHPQWLQRFANIRWFMAIYGLLGTIQAMSQMYFIVTLTTLEKRFKIPSQTTGIILSGNEISQILLSLILSYIGGQRNRPRWIAWGIVFCAVSCFILATPHFIYGAGEESNELTQEYWDNLEEVSSNKSLLVSNAKPTDSQTLCKGTKEDQECDNIQLYLPLFLVFLSQFVLGIGNTLYFSLGQTYLDDNTKKTNSPLVLALALSLRMIGPIFGFVLGYFSLNVYIDPTKTPLIDRSDPRWLGAWWMGWMFLGSFLLLFSGLLGIFPKTLPKKEKRFHSEVPRVLRVEEITEEDNESHLTKCYASNATLDKAVPETKFPELKDFPKALMRLLRNKLLMFNNISAVFYILGASGYMTFLSRYMEVQFSKSPQNATIVIGPLTIFGMVFSIIMSGLIITKKKPRPGIVLFWNVFVGCLYMLGQGAYFFLYCEANTSTFIQGGALNLSMPCNTECQCDGVSYNPVCHSDTGITFYSPCHAGCYSWNKDDKRYENCNCLKDPNPLLANSVHKEIEKATKKYEDGQIAVAGIASVVEKVTRTTIPIRTTVTSKTTLSIIPIDDEDDLLPYEPEGDIVIPTEEGSGMAEEKPVRIKREMNDKFIETFLVPGACTGNCWSFWVFLGVSCVINWLGSSGRIGNILINYRSVSTEDKSFAQGLTLMMLSLFALIPGPIIFGRLIDSSCLVWTEECGSTGNCQFYDQAAFRKRVNIAALCKFFRSSSVTHELFHSLIHFIHLVENSKILKIMTLKIINFSLQR
ncbi:hypothetical protein ACFFRR_003683 [Megaselia abdita]